MRNIPSSGLETETVTKRPLLLPDELSEVLVRHLDAACLLARRVLGDWALAEDAVQEACLRCIRHPPERRPEAETRGYFLRAVFHVAVGMKRSDVARRTREEKRAAGRDDTHSQPGSRLAKNELTSAAVRELDNLAPEMRAAVCLCVEQGQTVRDAARVLGVPHSTVQARVKRGLEQLRNALGAAGFAGVALPALAGLLRGTLRPKATAGLVASVKGLAASAAGKAALATAAATKGALALKTVTAVLVASAVAGIIVVSSGRHDGDMTDAFDFRDADARRECAMNYGGSEASERAVEASLVWLADHQEPDGRWSGLTEHGKHLHEGEGVAFGNGIDVGLTGLATLAFLGAGYTHETGRHTETVSKAIQWLVSQQDMTEGEKTRGLVHLKKDDLAGGGATWPYREAGAYGHAIAGLALAEAYGMTKDGVLLRHVQAAVDQSVNVRQRPDSGWRYRPREGPDLSVTGWYVMQLKGAQAAGLRIDDRVFLGAMNAVNEVTDEEGRARYRITANDAQARTYTPCMTSIGMACRAFMGARSRDPMLRGGAEYLGRYLPRWDASEYPADIPKPGAKGFYYWHWGTAAMFQVGGDAWREWNGVTRDMLVKNQRAAADGPDLDGSWDPGSGTSRVLSTALGALCLEVYYRYPRIP